MSAVIALVCLALGTVTELTSHWLRLWVYRPPWLRVASVVITFGLVFGWVASRMQADTALEQFGVGAGLGVAYEAVNLLWLHAWSFPGDRLLFLRGRVALILGAGIPWGILPVVAPVVAKLV